MEFKKTQKQIEATKLLASPSMHCMLYGGSRSGKTFIAIYCIIVRASKVKSRHVILRKTFNSVKTSVWMDTLPKVLALCFPDLIVKFNKSDYYMTLQNGSEVWVAGLDDDKRVEKILGKEYSTMYFNEGSQLSYSPVQIALTRLAEKNSLKKKAYYDMNPPTKKHWSYWLFEKKINPVESEPLNNPENYISMLMNPSDNMDNIDHEYINMLNSLPEKERLRFLEGKFVDGDDGLAYYSFDHDKNVTPVNRRPGTVFIGMDFNVDPMTAVIFQVFDDSMYVFDEVFLRNSDTFKMADELKRRGYMGDVIPDSTGRNRKTSGKSDFAILKEAGFNILSTHNPFVTDRVNNINWLLTNGRIFIDPKCKKLINDLNKVSWRDNKLDQKTDSLLTHISDCLGYGAYKLLYLKDTSNTKITSQRK